MSQLSDKAGYVGWKSSYGFIDTSTYQNHGLTGEFIFSNRIGIIYNLEYQRRSNKFNHIHGSMGSILGPPLIVIGFLSNLSNDPNDMNLTSSDFGLGYLGVALGIVMAVIPDGVTYHIPIRGNYDIAPYANFLGCDYIWNKQKSYSEWKYACSFGVKASYINYSDWVFQGFLETRKVASTNWGFGAGLSVAYAIGYN